MASYSESDNIFERFIELVLSGHKNSMRYAWKNEEDFVRY